MISTLKLKEFVNKYLSHIEEIGIQAHVDKEEGYKFRSVDHFQKNFNLESENLYEMIDKSLLSNNLVAGSMYYPKGVLLVFAEHYPDLTRNALDKLFDESVNVEQRINEVENLFEEIRIKMTGHIRMVEHTFMKLRFLSLLLSYRYPDKYNAIKPAEWKIFCKYIDDDFKMENGITDGERYSRYNKYIESLREYIKNNEKITIIRDNLTRGLEFRDLEYRWITQDIIYVTSSLISVEKSMEEIVPVDDLITSKTDLLNPEITSFRENLYFPLEKYLEDFMIKHWDKIDFGEKLDLYRDEDGRVGQQYPTDVGIIDILATDKNNNFVVIELKREIGDYKVVGQILNYIGWVRRELANSQQDVRGIIIVNHGDKTLLSSIEEVSKKVSLKYYKVDFKIIDPEK